MVTQTTLNLNEIKKKIEKMKNFNCLFKKHYQIVILCNLIVIYCYNYYLIIINLRSVDRFEKKLQILDLRKKP